MADNAAIKIDDDLGNIVSIHSATLAPSCERYCDKPTEKEEKDLNEKDPRFKKDSGKNQGVLDDRNVVDKVVGKICSTPQLRYEVRWNCHTNADDTAEPVHYILQDVIDFY